MLDKVHNEKHLLCKRYGLLILKAVAFPDLLLVSVILSLIFTVTSMLHRTVAQFSINVITNLDVW